MTFWRGHSCSSTSTPSEGSAEAFGSTESQFLHLSYPVSSASLRKDRMNFPECLFLSVLPLLGKRQRREAVSWRVKLEVKWRNRWRRQKKKKKRKWNQTICFFLHPEFHLCTETGRSGSSPTSSWLEIGPLSLVSPISFSYLLIHFLFSTHPSNLWKLLDNANVFNS